MLEQRITILAPDTQTMIRSPGEIKSQSVTASRIFRAIRRPATVISLRLIDIYPTPAQPPLTVDD